MLTVDRHKSFLYNGVISLKSEKKILTGRRKLVSQRKFGDLFYTQVNKVTFSLQVKVESSSGT